MLKDKIMTQKEKAKAYNEAFDRAKVIYQGRYKPDTAATIAEVLQNVFPELAESEDDRIRKSLIDLVKCNERSGYTLLNNVSTSSMLAWLEKQNSNSIKWNKNTKDNKPQVNHSVLMQTIYGVAEGEWRGENWYQYRWAGIIKDTDVLFWIELYDIERQGEQKSHKEDRLFTDEQSSVLSTACDNITPATKEQREFLFKKMKEAGYEWDKEKKELKKIEQKTAWSEEDLKNEIANQYESFYEEYLLYEQFADIAKHFFDLGLKAQKGE